ncbi:hypothetical protein [Rhodopirellula baltica]|uniref:hypothetical protein n=1 Tax=Rhodopirellula baltica TaxID=265606 RepID=UPI001F437DB3|nr:hypothetical protein [Rhodopirellula baltica]
MSFHKLGRGGGVASAESSPAEAMSLVSEETLSGEELSEEGVLEFIGGSEVGGWAGVR